MAGVCERRIYPVTATEYKLLEEIGQGVSATVYRAICLPFKEVVAIKALDLERCNSNLDDIRREAVTMSLINHANVVRAYCSFVVEQRLWVVMPYMAGGSCLHVMKSSFIEGFEEPVIATFLKEVLKALEYLHRHGHIHRDVKAGNILVDGTGATKLADFGVSACMFDTGDRQRSRKTFVGTPCWMAPEVMEQLHGYDFKADIWSFGITALELAHGHAPFSKYPPLKVLLMTLQNAPPALDYDRDKRFSKAFKEMTAMCLVKEPSKRPTAEKLLRHSFFKHARSPEYIHRHILDGLPPLGERIKNLKTADDSRLAQLDFEEQEQRSQTEYKRGVSCWNFNLEDLKAQSALIPDDDSAAPLALKECGESTESSTQPGSRDLGGSPDRGHLSSTLQSLKGETANGNGGYMTASRNCPSSKSSGRSMSGRKEPKHIGRFDVFEDDNVMESPGWHGSPKSESRRGDERELRKFDERERDESRKGASGHLVPERVLPGVPGRDEDQDRETRPGRVSDRGSFSGPLVPSGERACVDHRPANGVSRPSTATVTKDALEEKSKGPAQKVPVVQRGRFSVTSDDGGLEDLPHVSSRRNMCSQGSQQNLCVPAPSISPSNLNGVSVPAVALVPHLQNVLQLAVMQQDALMQILNGINPSETANSLRPPSMSKRSSEYSMAEIQSERERDYLQQIADLQSKFSLLLEEQKILKSRNICLERQLNAIYNKEEEERIRKEEAAKEDG